MRLSIRKNHFQVFLYILGPGGTGKSTVTLIAMALVGFEASISTTLVGLHKDPFEIPNLAGKKLILITDAEYYRGSISQLKAVVGGDLVRGRQKHIQGTSDLVCTGMVMITSNVPFGVSDNSNALLRRMITFRASNVSAKRDSLVYFRGGKFLGILAEEFSGIFNWVISIRDEEVHDYLVNTKTLVKSFAQDFRDAANLVDPLSEWIEEEIEFSDSGSYIGFYADNSVLSQLENSRRRSLFPGYLQFMRKQGTTPISQRTFSMNLVPALTQAGFVVKKVRKSSGYFIEGVRVKPAVYNRDNQFGAPLVSEKIKEETLADESIINIDSQDAQVISSVKSQDVELEENSVKAAESESESESESEFESESIVVEVEPESVKLEPYEFPDTVNNGLYEDYQKLLDRNDSKYRINKAVRFYFGEHEEAICHHCFAAYFSTDGCQIRTPEYEGVVFKSIQESVAKIKQFGAIAYQYKRMGTSPRMIPQTYGNSIYSTKKVVRTFAYEFISCLMDKSDLVVLDIDLVSCYTSILLGLYPDNLRALQLAIESEGGLWQHIRNEFVANGNESSYNKSAVKICAYSSFFQGGSAAMMKGLLEHFQKEAGMTMKQFRESSSFEKADELAKEIVGQMQNSEVILDFRAVSDFVFQTHEEKYLIGPTGHSYRVTRETFRTVYANYLQSYEFFFIMAWK